MSATKKKVKRFIIGVMLFFVLCQFLIFCMKGNTKQLCSDSAGAEFITEVYIIEAEIIISNGKMVE